MLFFTRYTFQQSYICTISVSLCVHATLTSQMPKCYEYIIMTSYIKSKYL